MYTYITYACIHIYTYIYTYTLVCTLYLHIHISIHIYTYKHIHSYTYTYTYTHIHIYTLTYTYTHHTSTTLDTSNFFSQAEILYVQKKSATNFFGLPPFFGFHHTTFIFKTHIHNSRQQMYHSMYHF